MASVDNSVDDMFFPATCHAEVADDTHKDDPPPTPPPPCEGRQELCVAVGVLVGIDFSNVHPLVRQWPDHTHIGRETPPTMVPKQNKMAAILVF